MNISHRIKSLLPCKEVSSIAELERACGISNGTIGKWGSGAYRPASRNLEKIASFLEVTTDYLLGNTDDPTPADKKNTPSELQILYERANPDDKAAIDLILKKYKQPTQTHGPEGN